MVLLSEHLCILITVSFKRCRLACIFPNQSLQRGLAMSIILFYRDARRIKHQFSFVVRGIFALTTRVKCVYK